MTLSGPAYMIEAADLDGDRDVDLAVGIGPLGTSITPLRNDGSGSFSVLPPLTVAYHRGIAVADLDGDLTTDIATCSSSGFVHIFGGRGDGSFEPAPAMEIGRSPDGLIAAELDGDGRFDLAILEDSAYGLIVLWNAGEGRFGEPELFQYGNASAVALVSGDMDLDSDPDLITCNRDSLDGIWVGINDGGGGFAKVQRFQLDGSLFDVAVADLDGDDVLDVATTNAQYDEIAVFLNATAPPRSRDCNRNGEPDECDVASGREEDCNRNGLLDSCEILSGGDRNGDGLLDDCIRPPFHRGDSNGDGSLDIADGVNTLSYLFNGSAEPGCLETADHDNDGVVDISDPVASLVYLFASGSPPASPGPPGLPCGGDPDAAGSFEDLGCSTYSSCATGSP